MQFNGERLDFEAQGRWLATHAAAGYEEYGGTARLAVRGRAARRAGRDLGFLVGWEPATAGVAADYRMEVRYSRPF